MSKGWLLRGRNGCYTGIEMSYSIDVEGFPSLEERWQELLQASPRGNIFLTPQWQKAWWQEFGAGRESLLLSVRRGAELVGIAPLMRQGDTISFIGDTDVCDYMDFIACQGQESAFSAVLLDYLEAMKWHSLDLHCLLPYSIALSHFAPLARERGYLVEIRRDDVSPQVVLPRSWEEYLSQLSGKDRRELRRKLRRLSQAGSAHYYTVEDRNRLPQDLEDFFRLFKQSGSDKTGFMTSQREGFFRAMAHSLAEKGYLRLSFLEVEGVRVATALCFDYGNELYLYNSGYDPAYSSLSVGLLLKVFCLKEGIIMGRRRFDFLRGAEDYKYNLGGQDVPLHRCLVLRR